MKKMFSLLLLVFAAIATQSFFPQSPPQASYQNGKSLYETHCMSCHMEDGNGLESVYPSLVKTGNLADKNKMAKIVLLGMRGKIVVKGITYDSEMAGIALTDKEVADVINYIRNSWGNKAPYIKAADVALAKKATVKGYRPY
jgi:nitrite reductase (NO-forming)